MGWREDLEKRQKQIKGLLSELGLEPPECGFDIGDGWIPIVADALKKMKATGIPFKLAQVKQKFCQLRIYWEPEGKDWGNIWQEDHPRHAEYVRLEEICREAERLCDQTCEACGSKAVRGGMATGQKLCAKCLEKDA